MKIKYIIRKVNKTIANINFVITFYVENRKKKGVKRFENEFFKKTSITHQSDAIGKI